MEPETTTTEEPVTDDTVESEPPKDVTYDDPDFVDPTPDDVIDKQDILIYLQQIENQKLKDQTEQDKLLLDKVSEKLDLLIDGSSEGDSTLSSTNEQILSKLDSIIENQKHLTVGSDTLVTYGVLYIPLAIIIFLLWRFFATFLRAAR